MTQKLAFPLAIASALALASTGCGKGSSKNVKIDGIDGPKTSFVDGRFLMTVTFKNVQLDGGIRVGIPNMPNSYMELAPDLASTGTILAIGLSTDDIKVLKEANLLPPTSLPGGRPLPGLADGYLPGVAVQVPRLNNVTFYIGKNVFGAFVPVRLGIKQAIGTFRFYADDGKQIGNLSIVGEDAKGENSGFLLLINFGAPTVAQFMK